MIIKKTDGKGLRLREKIYWNKFPQLDKLIHNLICLLIFSQNILVCAIN